MNPIRRVITNLVASSWVSSRYSDLPMVQPEVNEVVREFQVAAGGIALVLSRATPKGVEKEFPYTRELYLLLSKQLRRHGRTSASAELLNEVMHETAHVVDARTRQALRFCLDARAAHDRDRRRPAAPLSSGGFASGLSVNDASLLSQQREAGSSTQHQAVSEPSEEA